MYRYMTAAEASVPPLSQNCTLLQRHAQGTNVIIIVLSPMSLTATRRGLQSGLSGRAGQEGVEVVLQMKIGRPYRAAKVTECYISPTHSRTFNDERNSSGETPLTSAHFVDLLDSNSGSSWAIPRHHARGKSGLASSSLVHARVLASTGSSTVTPIRRSKTTLQPCPNLIQSKNQQHHARPKMACGERSVIGRPANRDKRRSTCCLDACNCCRLDHTSSQTRRTDEATTSSR